MKIIMQILGITSADVARRAGVTRQAAHAAINRETGPVAFIAAEMIALELEKPKTRTLIEAAETELSYYKSKCPN